MTALRVLIVDDEPKIRELARGVLEAAGMEVEEAADGDAAVRALRARLAQLHGSDGILTVGPSTPHGTVATIRIPYRVCPSEPAPSSADA